MDTSCECRERFIHVNTRSGSAWLTPLRSGILTKLEDGTIRTHNRRAWKKFFRMRLLDWTTLSLSGNKTTNSWDTMIILFIWSYENKYAGHRVALGFRSQGIAWLVYHHVFNPPIKQMLACECVTVCVGQQTDAGMWVCDSGSVGVFLTLRVACNFNVDASAGISNNISARAPDEV